MAEETKYFDSWLDAQKKVIDTWVTASKSFQDIFFGTTEGKSGVSDATREVYNLYNSWINTTGRYFDEMMKNYPIGVGRDTFSKFFSGADAYMKLNDYWSSLFKGWSEKGFDIEASKDLMDPAKYKDVIDKVFGFSTPDTMTEFFGQASKLVETWGSSAQNFVGPWAEAIQKSAGSYPDMLSGNADAGLSAFHTMYGAFENTFGKVFKMPKVGKDRDKIELMMTCLDKCSVYTAKNTEFQHKMYVVGQQAMNKVMEAISKRVKEGAEIKTYDEFFRLWTDINEDEYFELFKTDEFSNLQGAMLDSALDARRHIHQLMELYLEDYPIALRSEMNDVYKTVYDLRRKVRELDKKVAAMPASKEVKA